VSDSPERPSTSLSRKRTNTLVERTPGKLTPVRGPSALQSAPEPSQPAPPPPSTARARPYREGRKGAHKDNQRCRIKGQGLPGRIAAPGVRWDITHSVG